jgi:hypothetical protein
MPARLKRIKNKRGGQKGNQNARTHGFYSSALTPDQISRYWTIISQKHIDPDIALMNIKLQDLVQMAPAGRRTLKDVSRLLAKWFANKYHLNWSDRAYLRTAFLTVLEHYSGSSPIEAGCRRSQPEVLLPLRQNGFRKPPKIKKTNQAHSRVMQKHQNKSNRKTN